MRHQCALFFPFSFLFVFYDPRVTGSAQVLRGSRHFLFNFCFFILFTFFTHLVRSISSFRIINCFFFSFLSLLAAENNGSDTGVSPQTPTDEAATPTNAPISPPTSSLTPNSEAALGDDSDYLTGANVVRIVCVKYGIFACVAK